MTGALTERWAVWAAVLLAGLLAGAQAGAQEAETQAAESEPVEIQVDVDLGESVEVVYPTPGYALVGGAKVRVQVWRGEGSGAVAKSWQAGASPEIIVHDWRSADPSRIRVHSWQPFQTPAIRVSGY